MPKPRYIICAEFLLTDPRSGLVSHVNVVEEVTITHYSTAEARDKALLDVTGRQLARWVVSAVWSKDDSDADDDVFESQVTIELPNRKPEVIPGAELQFSTRFHRVDTYVTASLEPTAGVIRFVSSIRNKSGTEGWLTQSFEIPVICSP